MTELLKSTILTLPGIGEVTYADTGIAMLALGIIQTVIMIVQVLRKPRG
ncbi:MAG: hypothetical protein AAGC70_06250 [Pseudomonadota bacterium]